MKSLSCDVVVTCVLRVICLVLPGLATGSQEPVLVPYRLRVVQVRAPYGLFWMPYELGNICTINHMGPVWAQRIQQTSGSVRDSYGPSTDPARLPNGFLRAKNRKNPVSKTCTGMHGVSCNQLQVLRVSAHTRPENCPGASCDRVISLQKLLTGAASIWA